MEVKMIVNDSRFRQMSLDVELENKPIEGIYVGDLLSFVMANAKPNQLWLTVQTHPNIIAIASLLELSAVIVVSGIEIPQETIDLANEQGILLISSVLDAVEIIKLLDI
ncbi:MAG: hypothetical protein II005_04045 [Turicibacter sp.]|nr:hypothetical protein [Turicibacter sp.]